MKHIGRNCGIADTVFAGEKPVKWLKAKGSMRLSHGCHVPTATFLPFLQLRRAPNFNRSQAAEAVGGRSSQEVNIGDIMEDGIQKSCWGVTLRALVGFVGVLAIAYMFKSI